MSCTKDSSESIHSYGELMDFFCYLSLDKILKLSEEGNPNYGVIIIM
jgi:hypothetical protein